MKKELLSLASQSKNKKKSSARALPTLPEGRHELMLPTPYRRFWEQTANQRNQKWNKQTTIFVAVSIILPLIYIFFMDVRHPHPMSGLVSPIFNLIMLVFILSQAYKYLAAPNHMQLGAQGLRFHWLGANHLFSTPWIDWQAVQYATVSTVGVGNMQVQSIDIVIDTKRISGKSWASLFFMAPLYWTKRGLKLYTFSLIPKAMSLEKDTESFVAALRSFLPEESVDTSLAAFAGSDLPSYTHMWLNQLRSAQSSALELDPLEAGHRLYDGKYKIIERIAAGGQAITYMAENDQGQTVALKEFVMPTRGGMEI